MKLTLGSIQKIHKKYALNEEIYKIIYSHCQIVWEIANELIQKKNLKINHELVHYGALLHDIGAYKLINSKMIWNEKDYIKHGIIGYEILTNEGVDKPICEIARHHTGVGITREDVQNQQLPLPLSDYSPQTIEERLVMYADKFHSKTPRFNSFESYSKFTRKFGEDKVKKFEKLAQEFGKPDLNTLSEKYQQPII
jgi:uncharacterized protein